MDKILSIGKFVFPLSFMLYVGLHLGKPEVGADFVPDYLPFPLFFNYFTMVCIVAFIISALLQKFDKLAYISMSVYVLLVGCMVHLPRAMGHEIGTLNMAQDMGQMQELEMVNFFRNIMLTAALMAFARYVATDKRFVG